MTSRFQAFGGGTNQTTNPISRQSRIAICRLDTELLRLVGTYFETDHLDLTGDLQNSDADDVELCADEDDPSDADGSENCDRREVCEGVAINLGDFSVERR